MMHFAPQPLTRGLLEALADEFHLDPAMRAAFIENAGCLRAIGPMDVSLVARAVLELVRDDVIRTPDDLSILCALIERLPDVDLLGFLAQLRRKGFSIHLHTYWASFSAAKKNFLADCEEALAEGDLPEDRRERLMQVVEVLRAVPRSSPNV